MQAWELGRIAGIRIRVHWSFLILPIWIYFSSILAGSGMTAALATLLFVLAIFVCVLLHELGHALAARQFGIPTRNITLLPIGGVAALERMPRNPAQELWIAVAGPLVNVVIAVVLASGLILTGITLETRPGVFLWQLALANAILVVFNLIPAFPMDGGRILRSLLAMVLPWEQATLFAVQVGKLSAVGLGLWGLFSGNLMMVLVAAFVFFAAQSELAVVLGSRATPRAAPFQTVPPQTGQSPSDFPFGQEARGDASEGDRTCSVPASLSASSVAAWLANRQADYCRVVDSGRTIGELSRAQLLVALSRGMGHLPVSQLLR